MSSPLPPSAPTRPSIDDLARPQCGIVARAQLLVAGWSPSSIGRAVTSGHLIPVVRGIYRADGTPWTRGAAQHTALLIAGPRAVLSHWSAACLHGFAEPRIGPLDVTSWHTCRVPATSGRLLRLTRTRSLSLDDRCEIDGLRATSGARTVLDLAPRNTVGGLAELAAAGVRVGACTLDGLRRCLDAHPGARGRRRLIDALGLLGDDGADSRSDVEVAGLRALVGAGLPRPVVAHRVVDVDGTFVGEVDLAYPDHRIAIEIDGFRWHSSPEQKRRDEDRQNRLVLAGWIVLRFSASDVRSRPHLLVAAVRTALTPPIR